MNEKKAKKERKMQAPSEVKMPSSKSDIISNIIIGVVIAAFLGLGGYAVGTKIAADKANAGPDDAVTDQTPQTIESAAENEGIPLTEYLEKYGLDASTPGDTPLSEIYPLLTVENMAKFNNQDVETFRADNFVPDTISNDTPWKDVIPELPFKAVVGEEQVEQFKSVYGLDDTITADTKWKDVEPVLQQKQQELSESMDSAEKERGENTEDDTDTNSEKSEN